jgi:hypothetical protein
VPELDPKPRAMVKGLGDRGSCLAGPTPAPLVPVLLLMLLLLLAVVVVLLAEAG